MIALALQYTELVEPKRRYDKILRPDEIPIHPSVYTSPFAFTPDFLREVRRQMPQALRDDISEIERILGEKSEIVVTEESIAYRREETRFDQIEHKVNPVERKLSVGVYASTIGILPHLPRPRVLEINTGRTLGIQSAHPLSQEKALEYAFDSDGDYLKLYTWYTHNLHDQGEPLFHYLRTFAILFNNLGLAR